MDTLVQKCQCYYTLSNQSIPLVTVTSVVSLLTEQLWLRVQQFSDYLSKYILGSPAQLALALNSTDSTNTNINL